MSNMPCYINVSRILSFCIWIESQNQNYSRSFILKFSSGEDSLPPPTDPSGIFAALELILQPTFGIRTHHSHNESRSFRKLRNAAHSKNYPKSGKSTRVGVTPKIVKVHNSKCRQFRDKGGEGSPDFQFSSKFKWIKCGLDFDAT